MWPFSKKSTALTVQNVPVDETKGVEISSDLWQAMTGAIGALTKSGTVSSTDAAMMVPAFYRAVRVVADGIAQLPVEIYKETGKGKSEPAKDHPLYDLLRWQPSELQNAHEFFTTILMHAVASGNSVCYKVMVNGQLRELIPVRPEGVNIQLNPNTMVKEFTFNLEHGKSFSQIGKDQVFHFSGPQWRPYKGMDPVSLGREAIGLARAIEESQARLHSNGVRLSGVLSTDQKLDKTQVESLRTQLTEAYAGVANAMKTLIASGGLKFMPMSMTGVDAQTIETRHHQIEEICRVIGVNPVMVGANGDGPTFASADVFFESHVKYTLQTWIAGLKAAINTQLLTAEERAEGYHCRIDTSELIRGSLEARSNYYQKALGTNSNPGWLTPNEVRQDDGWDTLPDLDEVMSPLTMSPAGAPPGGPGAPGAKPPNKDPAATKPTESKP